MPSTTDLQPVSPDFFKSWSRCYKQFYYKYVRKLNWPSDGRHFKLGRDVHKLLDYQARGLDCSLLLKDADENVRISWEKLMTHSVTRLPVLANEWGFHVPVGNRWLVGRMDRVAKDGDQVIVIDWKTGTGVPRNPETDWQTLVYLYALVEISRSNAPHDLGIERLSAEQVSFAYVEVKADNRTPVRIVTVPYSEARHEESRRIFTEILATTDRESAYALPQTCPDRYCQYSPICGIDAG
jgi:CRISPR/Cas system-associated exonuclease Cas4 (RecB family)